MDSTMLCERVVDRHLRSVRQVERIIRPAGVFDVDTLVKYAPDFLAETADYYDLDFDPQKTAQFLTEAVWAPNRLLLVAEEGVFSGVLLAGLEDTYFGDNLIAREIFFYIRPKFRRFSLARRMIMCYCDWAENCGATRVFLSSNAGYKTESAIKLYERCGFKFTGSTACRRI